jgi:hypothetical protein
VIEGRKFDREIHLSFLAGDKVSPLIKQRHDEAKLLVLATLLPVKLQMLHIHLHDDPQNRFAAFALARPRQRVGMTAEFARLDILLEAVYPHLACLLKNSENVSNCCRGLWTC